MSTDLTKQLQGTRAEVLSAVKTIDNKLKQILKRGTDSVAYYALVHNVQVLRQLCLALQANCHKHAELYCDIVELLLAHVKPYGEKETMWDTHLSSLRYIHYGLCREQTITECQRIYALINSQHCRLQTESNFKHYYAIHLSHFNMFQQQLQKETTSNACVPKNEIYHSLTALGTLFEEMSLQKRVQHFNYTNLLSELNQMLFYKRSTSFLNFLSQLPMEHTKKMYEPLFRLLECNTLPAAELSTQFKEYLGIFLALLQIDIFAAVGHQQLALQLLRSCRELFKESSTQHYAIQLLYYYVKLLYVREDTPDFKRTYIDLCNKFVRFFELKCADLTKEQWFMDLLIVLQRLQAHLHHKSAAFEIFWQQLQGKGCAEAYAAHLELLQSCSKISSNITSSAFGIVSCNPDCKSLRKHCNMSLGLCALMAYNNCENQEQLISAGLVKTHLLCIVRHIVDLAESMKCLNSSSIVTGQLMRQFVDIASKISSNAQLSFLLELVEVIQSMRHLLGNQEWLVLLHRIYKASSKHCEDAELAAQLHSCYITATAYPSRQRNQMIIFYKSSKEFEKCVYEVHEQSSLRNKLTNEQKRQLYEMDMAVALTYFKTNISLLQSLLRCRQTDYQFVLLARRMRTDKDIVQQFDDLAAKLRRLSFKQPLTRLQHLVQAHAMTVGFQEAFDAQKTKIPIKETVEDKLEEMFVKYNRLSINVGNEKHLLQLATNVINAFASFYYKADEEFLSSEVLIDWEAIVDDIIAAAQGLLTMGYMKQANEAWLLLLRIAQMLGDRFAYLRAITHFLSNGHLQVKGVDLEHEVSYTQTLLDELWPQLQSNASLFKRHHTLVLLCFCHLANYYAFQGQQNHAQLLLLHVQCLRDEFEERRDKCDIVLITLQWVRFRMLYQQRRYNHLPSMPTALCLMDKMLESVRNFYCISSIDTSVLLVIMCELLRDSVECNANRLSERLPLLNTLLNTVLQYGLALRSVEVFVSWLWTHLQMESLDKANVMLRLIEHMLCVKPLRSIVTEPNEKSSAALETVDTLNMKQLVSETKTMQLHQDVATLEPIRKQAQVEPEPVVQSDMQNLSENKLQLLSYFDTAESHPELRDNAQLQQIFIVVGCLHARLYYLNRDHEQLNDFYERANAWLQNANLPLIHAQILAIQQIYYANYLRAKQNPKAAVKHIEAALNQVLKGGQQVDINYGYNLLLQLKTAQMELQPKLFAIDKPKIQARALQFNISPEQKMDLPAPPPITQKPAESQAKNKNKFKIYTELDYVQLSSPEYLSSTSSSDLDLNACQLIENIDLSDSGDLATQEAAARLKRNKSKPIVVQRSTRNRQQNKPATAITIIELDDSVEEVPVVKSAPTKLQRCKSVDVGSTRKARSRNTTPEELPETTTTSRRGRPRRQNSVADIGTVSTKLRQRN